MKKLAAPKTGRVLIIDDKIEEAKPLLEILSKNSIPTTYFDGRSAGLPPKPMEGIRLVFLDLQLIASTDSKNICSAIAGILKKTVSNTNGPYLLLAWSQHEAQYLDDVKKLFENGLKEIRPIGISSLDKTAYMQSVGAGGKFRAASGALKKIEESIKKCLASEGMFHLLLLLENTVHEAGWKVVHDISEPYPADGKWNENVAGVFLGLAEANAGRQVDGTKQIDVILKALPIFANLFADTLSRKLFSQNFSVVAEVSAKNKISTDLRAKLNAKLLTTRADSPVRPGDILAGSGRDKTGVFGLSADVWDWERIRKNHNAITASKNTAEEVKAAVASVIKKIRLEISPSCDWANKKWCAHRVLDGVILPYKYFDGGVKRAEYSYTTPVLEIDGEQVVFSFDFRSLRAVPLGKLRGRAKLALRHELLVDIQQKLAHHVSRPGIQQITQ